MVGYQEALAVEWDKLVVPILLQDWGLKAAQGLRIVGQGQSLGSSDDVCIIFHPSPFCKLFFPLHPLTWHPPSSLLCTVNVEDPSYVTMQTHPGGPKALVLQAQGPGAVGLEVALGGGPSVLHPRLLELVGPLALQSPSRHPVKMPPRISEGSGLCDFLGPGSQVEIQGMI